MNNTPRLVAFDLDDTLLLPSGEISARTRQAVNALHKSGVIVALASGRMLPTMLPIAEALDFAPALVSYNGAQVNLTSEAPPLYHRPVPAGLAEQVIDYALQRNLHLHFYYDNRLFATDVDDWKARLYREQTDAFVEHEPNFNRFRGLEPTKLLIVDEPEPIEKLQAECRELFGSQVTITLSKPIYLEFLHPSVHKGAGFEALCRHLDVALEDSAAFGDSFNDLEMLRSAGTAIVVENGIGEAKAVAHRICASNEEDGVAQVLEEWLSSNNEDGMTNDE